MKDYMWPLEGLKMNIFSELKTYLTYSFLILDHACTCEQETLKGYKMLKYMCNRGCRYGGDGSSGYVLSLGPCMAWLLHNLVM